MGVYISSTDTHLSVVRQVNRTKHQPPEMVDYEFAVRIVSGSRSRETAGPARVDIYGIRSIQAGCVQSAIRYGNRHSVYSVNYGHDMMTGMYGRKVKKRSNLSRVPRRLIRKTDLASMYTGRLTHLSF